MGYKPDWQNGSMKKPAGHKCSPGIQSRELFHGAKPVMKYADGGEVDLPELREPTEADRGDSSPTSVADLPELREPSAVDSKPAAPQKFGEAFKSARASGAKDFEWNGKKYTTQIKEEVKAAAKPAVRDDRNEMDKHSDSAAARNYRNEMDKQSDKASAPAPAAQPSGGSRYGRGAVKADQETSSGSTGASVRKGKGSGFSLANNSGKYVPSTGVAVKK